jgi:hypothetical protein
MYNAISWLVERRVHSYPWPLGVFKFVGVLANVDAIGLFDPLSTSLFVARSVDTYNNSLVNVECALA